MTWGNWPGAIKVLVPLPLLVRKPWLAPPGRVVVCTEPKLPVMYAGPRNVSKEVGAAKAGTAAPSSHAIAAAANIVRSVFFLQLLRAVVMCISCFRKSYLLENVALAVRER
jgi:hypothetical protein